MGPPTCGEEDDETTLCASFSFLGHLLIFVRCQVDETFCICCNILMILYMAKFLLNFLTSYRRRYQIEKSVSTSRNFIIF